MDDELIPQPSWWKRNWKWAVPTGGCLLVIILIIAFAGAIFVGVTSIIEESTPYQDALEATQQNEEVVLLLGEPIETHGLMQGTINTSGSSGAADLSIPVKGPNGEGTLFVKATRIGGSWNYELMQVMIKETRETINLLESDSY